MKASLQYSTSELRIKDNTK